MKNVMAAVVAGLALAGCARNVWVKDGADQQDFNVDHYSCEKDARQSGYYGTGLAGALNMQNFFNECMVAHGWHLERQARY
jgi:hypothetical protein